MQTSSGLKPNRVTSILIVIGIGILAILPAIFSGIPLGADLDNHFRFAQPFYDEILSGNVIPGWLAESNNGFGDARFRFYPPLLYYMLAAARVLTGDWYFATLFTFSMLSVLGCIGIYLWTRLDHGRGTALIAVAIFAALPYHAAQFYQASLLAEFCAMSILPFAFLFVDRLSRKDFAVVPNVVGVGAAFAFIILSHIPTTIVGGIGLGLFALLCAHRSNKRSLLLAACGIGLALLLSSFFWIKVLTELSWIQAGHKITSEHYDYRNNFLFSPWSLTNLNTWLGSVIAAVTFAVFLPAILLFPGIFGRAEKNAELFTNDGAKKSIRSAIVVAVFAFFMTTDLSRPLWLVIPKLPDIQFPYRWLTVASVAICPAAAIGFMCLIKKIAEKQIRAWQLAVVVISFAASVYSVWEFTLASDFLDRETFTKRIEASRAAPSFPDWLPVGAAQIKDVKPMTGPIDAGTREILEADITTHKRRFKIAPGPETEARIRAYHYPLWQATINGKPTQTKKAPDGTLLIEIPTEGCELFVRFGK